MAYQDEIRVGVIGLGVGEAHIKSYQSVENCTVESICDLDKERLNEIGAKYKIKNRSVDFTQITENPDIQIVSICSYDNFHMEHILSALRNGKHVMVEKPAVLFPKEAEKVIEELQKSKLLLTSNLILRQSPRFVEVKQMVANGELGEIFHIEADYLHNILWKITSGWRGKMDFYCTVYGGGVHLIDLMRWIMNEEITSVCAMGTGIAVEGSKYKWPDTITSLLKWKCGATGKCTSSFAPMRTKFHSLNIYGTKKSYVNGMPNATLFDGDEPHKNVSSVCTPYPGMEKGDLIPEFVSCIRLGKEPSVNSVDVFRVMSVCFAIWEATRTGKHVDVDYLC